MKKVVVIGAGAGGLAAAAVLARQGLDVTVLEAHVSPGGCASTFYHQAYRFDAGATLAGGFYPGGPMDRLAQAAGIDTWGRLQPVEPTMVVHLPDGDQLPLWCGEQRWKQRSQLFSPQGRDFWRWQESAADAMWDLALRLPDWPPADLHQAAGLAHTFFQWLGDDPARRLSRIPDIIRTAASRLPPGDERLRLLVDGQLLISAQTTSSTANALYAAAALDLPRRGVVHLEGGLGAIAQALVEAVRRQGGQVIYRQEATRICFEAGHPVAVETRRGASFPADLVIGNLSPGDLSRLCSDLAPSRLRRAQPYPADGWGAFVVYAGLEESVLPALISNHHQVLTAEPFGEGFSVFLSISPGWDTGRAPAGRRAVTISTHTALRPWWDSFENDRGAYEQRKAAYCDRLLTAAERVIPGLRQAVDLVLPGTPVTFQRFTHRTGGWVGGFPQTSLLRSWGPRLAPGLWMVGDSIFPGQSVAAAALGGLRVALDLLKDCSVSKGQEKTT